MTTRKPARSLVHGPLCASISPICLPALALFAASVAGAADGYLRQPGVDVLAYRFAIDLSDESDAIAGRARIELRLLEPRPQAIELDLVARGEDGRGMTVEGVDRIELTRSLDAQTHQPLEFVHRADRLRVVLPPRSSAPSSAVSADDRLVLEVRYRGTPREGLVISPNKHRDRTFFGDNWPEGARHWLPTIDHPSDKALCGFAVTAPSHYQVVGCGRLREETDLPEGRRLTVWRSEAPMATKVMVIGVARFAVERLGEVDGVELESWVFPQEREAGFFDFARAERVLRFFVSHLGPFPYAKLANVQSRTRYGGTENASNIFYNENSVKGDRSNEALIAHEIAHQWFGDAVTEGDWQHVWLSEGFATYLTQLYLELTYGRDRLEQGMRRARDRVFEFAREAPSSAVIEPGVGDPQQLLTANSYQKGAWVLHMLRREVGDEALWQGLRELYRRFRHQNAVTSDFVQVMEEVSGRDLEGFFHRWLQRPGHPVLAGEWRLEEDSGEVVIDLAQRQAGEPYPLTIDVDLVEGGGARRRESLEMPGRSGRWRVPASTPVQDVVLDPDVWLLAEVERFGRR